MGPSSTCYLSILTVQLSGLFKAEITFAHAAGPPNCGVTPKNNYMWLSQICGGS